MDFRTSRKIKRVMIELRGHLEHKNLKKYYELRINLQVTEA